MTNTHDLSLSIESWQLCRPATAKLNRVGPYQSHVSHINEVLQVSKPRQTQFMHNIPPTPVPLLFYMALPEINQL